MPQKYLEFLAREISSLQESGLYKTEQILTGPQEAVIDTQTHRDVLNLCANNYLGLANHPFVVDAAHQALEQYGYGLSSVRFICGTQTIHRELEEKLSHYLKTEATILYSSCFDANIGLFETLLGEEDAIISDALNHASIIDGIRLCKAARFRYHNNDMNELEQKLIEAQQYRYRLIATDGVFSMEGTYANLPAICDLADRYNALVMVDDSHAVGFVGAKGRGTPEYWQVESRVDIRTGTLGKALGGASGGYVSGKKEIIAWLRQRSRPYLFSNTLAPVITATSIAVLTLLENESSLQKKLMQNTQYFRDGVEKLKFKIIPGEHPIIPIMIGDAKRSSDFAKALLEQGLYVVSFSYPVVPLHQARIRTQMSASFSIEQLDFALKAFEKVQNTLSGSSL